MRNDLGPRRKYFMVVENDKECIPLNIPAGYERFHETVESILHEQHNFP